AQRLAILAGALAIAGGSGAGIALAIQGGDGNNNTTVPPPPPSSTHLVSVQVQGKGTGSVRGPRVACPKDCRAFIADGRTITLVATPADNSVFTRWSQDSCGRATRCKLTVTAPLTITATFALAADKRPPTTPADLRASAASPSEIDLSWTASFDN